MKTAINAKAIRNINEHSHEWESDKEAHRPVPPGAKETGLERHLFIWAYKQKETFRWQIVIVGCYLIPIFYLFIFFMREEKTMWASITVASFSGECVITALIHTMPPFISHSRFYLRREADVVANRKLDGEVQGRKSRMRIKATFCRQHSHLRN